MTQPPSDPSWDDPPADTPAAGPSGTPPPPPPPGAVPPPGGYPPPPPPPGYTSADDKTWTLVAHFGGAVGMFVFSGVGGWIAPLIALLTQGAKSPQVRAHAVAALNFQLLLSIVGAVGWITACFIIGFFIAGAAAIVGIVFGILAGVKANEGQFYTYPFNISLIK
jgi:uncharacterized Tic20 family protein